MAAVVLGAFALTILHGRHHGAAQSPTASAQSASAKTTCWKQIQDDWVNDGTIQGVYPLHCYGKAIKHVPNDLQQYTGIIDDITAARQRASRLRFLTGSNSTQPRPTEASPNDPGGGVYNSAIDRLGPTNSDSLPLPLLILAGLALIMVAAGAVGLASRHLKARKSAA